MPLANYNTHGFQLCSVLGEHQDAAMQTRRAERCMHYRHHEYWTSACQESIALDCFCSRNRVARRYTQHAAVHPEALAGVPPLCCLQELVQHLQAPAPVLLPRREAVRRDGQITTAGIIPAAEPGRAASQLTATKPCSTTKAKSNRQPPCMLLLLLRAMLRHARLD